jgi:hypothetical protein
MSSLFSRLIGSNIPHSIYLSQTLDIKGNAMVGDSVKCKIEIKESLSKNRYRLLTVV